MSACTGFHFWPRDDVNHYKVFFSLLQITYHATWTKRSAQGEGQGQGFGCQGQCHVLTSFPSGPLSVWFISQLLSVLMLQP